MEGRKEESGNWVRLEEDEGDDSKIGNISRGFLFRRRVSTLDPMGLSHSLSLSRPQSKANFLIGREPAPFLLKSQAKSYP